MSDRAELLSLNCLTDMDGALGRFASRGRQGLDDVEAALRRHMALLEERHREAMRHVRICEAECNSSSDNDDSDPEQNLEQAQERLRRIESWQTRTTEAIEIYRLAARRFEQLAVDLIPKARLKLQTKFDDAASYLSVQVEGGVPTAPLSSTREASRLLRPPINTPIPDSLVSFPLPPGFRWIAIDHISRSDDLREDEGFSKVSEEDVRRVFGTLRRKVLPYLRDHPETTDETFRDLDGYSEQLTIRSRQLTYQIFFGSEPIVLDGPKGDGTFSVTNGRHRIRVARDLGWSAVPARVVGED